MLRGAMDFDEFVSVATGGKTPYCYQRRLAETGLPDVLRVPTGAGKTLAATLPWLYRRIHGQEATRWLVLVLPQRVLVEQTFREVRSWLTALREKLPRDESYRDLLEKTSVHLLMGGEDRDYRRWIIDPHRSRIFVGTQDMVLSRLLMRGYAESRASWPISFGLFHSGTQFVFDEVQLMGPGLRTSLQLQGLREAVGTAAPCKSMWMSATVDVTRLQTVDFTRPVRVAEVLAGDVAGDDQVELKRRLAATRRVLQIDHGGVSDLRSYIKALAERVVAEHRPGTRTLVVLNTVGRAVELFRAVSKLAPSTRIRLLHSRFRPDDRKARTYEVVDAPALSDDIVISTQVLEAGVNITSTTLITELAPWSSIVQRAGRCNRDGEAEGARLLWTVPPPGKGSALPYDQLELDNSAAVLRGLQDQAVTSAGLTGAGADVSDPVYPTLRRRDLRDLFDTAPDLNGNDIDVGPFIRDADDRTVYVAWRVLPLPEDTGLPGGAELCPAPPDGVRELVERGSAVVFDQRDGRWRPALRGDVQPTAILVFDAAQGGYRSDIGFDPSSRAAVPLVEVAGGPSDSMDTDPQSSGNPGWLTLAEHLADAERETRNLLDQMAPDLPSAHREAVAVAARWHDLGKATSTFQQSLIAANPESPPPDEGKVWAKSPGTRPLRHNPPHFRHELVSALLLSDHDLGLLTDEQEPDLIVFLALAHHGKVRVTVRAAEGEPRDIVRGVRDGEITLSAELPGGQILPPHTLSLASTRIGPDSLTNRALRLRDRADIGPFRLAFYEALVRCADWKVSKNWGEDSA
jgi:CRISPR-associated endonuclease/helicase Cas3